MNKKMQDALDDYVKGQIVSKARANAPKKRVIKGLHIGDAYDKFCKHLASDGRRVLEKAMK